MGVPFEPILHLGVPKGVYVGALSEVAIECLRGGKRGRGLGDGLAVDEAVEYWRDVLLPRRAENARTQALISESVAGGTSR